MIYIRNSRRNSIGFLHSSDENAIDGLLGKWYSIVKFRPSFYELCDKVMDLYKSKCIDNKTASRIFEIARESNSRFRTESHRFENGTIYYYDLNADAYLFLKKGTIREFNKINTYID